MMTHRIIAAYLFTVTLPAAAQNAAVDIATAVQEVGQLQKPAKPVEMFTPKREGGVAPAGLAAGIVADEFLSIVAEIAVDRARRQGLAIVKSRIETGVCSITLRPPSGTDEYSLQKTCALVRSTDLQALVGQGRALRAALTTDVTEIIIGEIPQRLAAIPPLARSASMTTGLLKRFAADPNAQLTKNDVWLLADSILNSDWSKATVADEKAFKVFQVAVASARVYVQLLNSGSAADSLDLAEIIRQVRTANCPNCAFLDEALNAERLARWTNLAVRAATAMRARSEDLHERLRSIISLVFDAATAFSPKDVAVAAAWYRTLALAAVDGDAPQLIAALADAALVKLGQKECASSDCPSLRKLTALLTGISTYALTYQRLNLEEATPQDIAALERERREARKQALEGVIDVATDRRNRAGDTVMSLGCGVGGLLVGSQSLSRQDATSDDDGGLAGELHVPLGFAVQRLPAREARWNRPGSWGYHAMVNVIDLGYYITRDPAETATAPPWESIIAPGIQVGIILGRNTNNFFVLGYNISHSPRFGDRNVSATRHGVVLHFFLPLFDLN